MSTQRTVATLLALLSLTLGAAAPADEPAAKSEAAGRGSLLGLLGGTNMPSLSGLIQPEKMGMLTDNRGNQTHLLSDNALELLSGNRLRLSLLTVRVEVNVQRGDDANKKSNKQRTKNKSKAKAKSKARRTNVKRPAP